MILMKANPFQGPLEGVGPELNIETFLGSEMATSKASAIWAQKVEIFRAQPFQWPD